MLHHARMTQQFEMMAAAASNSSASSLARDKAMAENVGWIRDHAAPDAKIVLWAHNGHINAVPGFMGGYLRARYADDYRTLGFLFGQGRFNAVGSSAPLQSWSATLIPGSSIESVFKATDRSLVLFDARRILNGGPDAAVLAGPIAMRSIGAVFNPTVESAYFTQATFPGDFDLLVYVANTTASTLLSFTF
jgi:erythromycin esterase